MGNPDKKLKIILLRLDWSNVVVTNGKRTYFDQKKKKKILPIVY